MTGAKVLGVTTASGIFGKLLVGLISDKIGRRSPLIMVLFVQTVSLLGFMYGKNLESLYTSGICLGFSFGGSITLFPLLAAEFFEKGIVGKAFGIITLGGSIGASIGPFVGGAVFDLTKSYFSALLVGVLISVLALGTLVSRPFRKRLV
jgi:MFS family permease